MPEIPVQPESRVQPTPLETARKVVAGIRSTITDSRKLTLITASAGLAFLTACSGGESNKQQFPPVGIRAGSIVSPEQENRMQSVRQRIERIETRKEKIKQTSEEKRAAIVSREVARKENLALRDKQNARTVTGPQLPKQPEPSTQSPLVPEENPLVQLRREIDQRFGIELWDEPQIHWEVQYIEQLKRVLPSLPEQLYQRPSKTNAKLVLLLTSEGGSCCRIIGGAGNKRVGVAVGKEFFDKGDWAARSVLAHELTHYLEDLNRGNLFRDINRDIFGGGFFKVEDVLKTRLIKARDQYNTPGIFEKYFRLQTLTQSHNQIYGEGRHALSNKIYHMLQPSEFLAFCAERYVMGKEQFFHIFRDLFEEKTVAQLYDFTKREVFQGKEY